MSLQLMYNLYMKHTPDEFVREFLIPTLRVGKQPDRIVVGAANLGSKRNVVQGIILTDGHRSIPLQVAQTHASAERAARGQSASSMPHISIGRFSRIEVDPEEFNRAVDFFGKQVNSHGVFSSSETHSVGLPVEMFSHWGRSKWLIKPNGRRSMVVKITPNVFNELDKEMRVDTFVNRYMDVFHYFNVHNIRQDTLAAHLHIMPRESCESHPIHAFFDAHDRDLPVIVALANGPTPVSIAGILERHFGPSERIAGHASHIFKVLKSQEARQIARRLVDAATTYRYNKPRVK
ncbi:MAG: hypothetical protein V1722_05330 [Candidatus Micrarchaeota archaeon]